MMGRASGRLTSQGLELGKRSKQEHIKHNGQRREAHIACTTTRTDPWGHFTADDGWVRQTAVESSALEMGGYDENLTVGLEAGGSPSAGQVLSSRPSGKSTIALSLDDSRRQTRRDREDSTDTRRLIRPSTPTVRVNCLESKSRTDR